MRSRSRYPAGVHRSLAVLIAVLLSVAAVACGDGGSDRLTVYSGRTENLIGPLLDEFSEETGIGIDVRYGNSADLALLISEEGDRSPADVFISQSPGAVGFLAEQDLLATVDAEVLELVDPEFAAADGSWVGLSGRVRVLVYNTDLVDPDDLPSSVLDLVDDEFAGQVAVAPTNGSFQDFVTAMRGELGEEETLAWLEGMADNGSPVYANNTAIVEAVGRGEVPMGLVNHYYNVRALVEDPSTPSENHHFDATDIGSLTIVTAAGILASSSQPEQAAELIEFLLSEPAQRYFVEETQEYALAAGVDSPDLPPLDALAVGTVDLDALGGGLEGTRELIRQSGIER